MKIVALYLTDHAYLSIDFNLINFGGKYIYNLIENSYPLTVERRPNLQYIQNFFDISASEIRLENVSAIVGQNGVGKSSLLDVIRGNFIENEYALPRVRSVLLIEDGETVCFFSKEEIEIQLHVESSFIKLKKIKKENFQTIFYSPHFDLRYNPNFDEIDYFDISLDKYIDLDLEDLGSRGKNQHGVDYPIKQELLFKNSVRQIFFLNSNLVRKGIFKEMFDFPTHGNATLTFRETKYDNISRNVPYAFRPALEELKKKIDAELDGWVNISWDGATQEITKKLNINRYLLKRNLLNDLLSVIIRQMDVSNSYLTEGLFNNDEFEISRKKNAFECFLAFLNACEINTTNGLVRLFNTESIAKLINKIYDAIDRVNDEKFLKPNELIVPPADSIAILDLHRTVVLDISDYYHKQFGKRDRDYNRFNYLVPGFIFYSPTDRNLSSGENAILNLFSRLYSFIENKFNPINNPKEDLKSFLLLFDEADLGFHPVWKKGFINALVRTIPYFFEIYKQKPSLQIIFTTHDPLTLSDLPNANVVCLVNDDGKVKALDQTKRLLTFGANITDLLADSFFINDGLIGDFAKHKINDAIKWLEGDSIEKSQIYSTFINMIDEPIVKRKLAEMYDEKMGGKFEVDIIEQQIEELQRLKKRLLK